MAQGSHATLDGYTDVKTCATCGQKLTGSMSAQREKTILPSGATGSTSGWHSACGRPQGRGDA